MCIVSASFIKHVGTINSTKVMPVPSSSTLALQCQAIPRIEHRLHDGELVDELIAVLHVVGKHDHEPVGILLCVVEVQSDFQVFVGTGRTQQVVVLVAAAAARHAG
jgi:hypothetical protein